MKFATARRKFVSGVARQLSPFLLQDGVRCQLSGVEQGQEVLVDVPHYAVTKKEDGLVFEQFDGVIFQKYICHFTSVRK